MREFKAVVTGGIITRIALVTGGRDFIPGPSDYCLLTNVLLPGTKLMHGACPTGADAFAHDFAVGLGVVDIDPYPAEWEKYGLSAGPRRNRKMLKVLLKEQKPTIVVAFKGGRGTHDMVSRAKAAGLHVIEADKNK